MRKFFLTIFLMSFFVTAHALPRGFVYLRDIDPSIIQEMRYASSDNFMGRPFKGYIKHACILTQKTAYALANIQKHLLKKSLSLKVFDCYRPKRAVDDIIAWSYVIPDQSMKAAYYPRIDKREVFQLGYVAENSGHSRGSTVDITVVNLLLPYLARTKNKQGTVCRSPIAHNEIDMGSAYDCLDPISDVMNNEISSIAQRNRYALRNLFFQYGFEPYSKEWWHFTLKNEMFPKTYFDFQVE